MSARGVGVLCVTIAARRVGGWSGFLLRTLLGYGFGSFIFAAGTATCSGCEASRAVWAESSVIAPLVVGWWPGPELAVDEARLARGLLVLVQGALAAGVATGRLYGGLIEIPVLINDVVAGQKLHELTGGRAR